jgi:hypothetical protein
MSNASFITPAILLTTGIALAGVAAIATPTEAAATNAATMTVYTRTLNGWSAGTGVLAGDHCETTVALNPANPPANVTEVELQGVEAPTLTFTPFDFYIESPNLSMNGPNEIDVETSDGTKEWWRGFALEFNGAFDSGMWTIYVDEHPQGCAFYNNTTRLEFDY